MLRARDPRPPPAGRAVVRSEQIDARGRRVPEVCDHAGLSAGRGARKDTPDDRNNDDCRRRSLAGYPPKVGRATHIGTALVL